MLTAIFPMYLICGSQTSIQCQHHQMRKRSLDTGLIRIYGGSAGRQGCKNHSLLHTKVYTVVNVQAKSRSNRSPGLPQKLSPYLPLLFVFILWRVSCNVFSIPHQRGLSPPPFQVKNYFKKYSNFPHGVIGFILIGCSLVSSLPNEGVDKTLNARIYSGMWPQEALWRHGKCERRAHTW